MTPTLSGEASPRNVYRIITDQVIRQLELDPSGQAKSRLAWPKTAAELGVSVGTVYEVAHRTWLAECGDTTNCVRIGHEFFLQTMRSLPPLKKSGE